MHTASSTHSRAIPRRFFKNEPVRLEKAENQGSGQPHQIDVPLFLVVERTTFDLVEPLQNLVLAFKEAMKQGRSEAGSPRFEVREAASREKGARKPRQASRNRAADSHLDGDY